MILITYTWMELRLQLGFGVNGAWILTFGKPVHMTLDRGIVMSSLY